MANARCKGRLLLTDTIEFCRFLGIEDGRASISHCKYKIMPGACSADDLPRLGDEEAGGWGSCA